MSEKFTKSCRADHFGNIFAIFFVKTCTVPLLMKGQNLCFEQYEP